MYFFTNFVLTSFYVYAILKIVKDVFLRYGNKSSPELLIHAYGKYETGLSGYSKIGE